MGQNKLWSESMEQNYGAKNESENTPCILVLVISNIPMVMGLKIINK
jgi:hypothetical protein